MQLFVFPLLHKTCYWQNNETGATSSQNRRNIGGGTHQARDEKGPTPVRDLWEHPSCYSWNTGHSTALGPVARCWEDSIEKLPSSLSELA